jgi:hypothetical protein
MRIVALALTTLLLGSGPALATISLFCDFQDGTLAFEAQASLGTGPGGHFATFDGKLETKAKGVPDDLRNIELGLEHLTQRWLHQGDLKLHLYRERTASGPDGFVDLVIEARRVRDKSMDSPGSSKDSANDSPDEIDYRGSYVLTIHYVLSPSATEGHTVTLRGNAVCKVG